MQNMEWLQEQLGDNDDDYFLFDCPGELWYINSNIFTINAIRKNSWYMCRYSVLYQYIYLVYAGATVC